MSRIHKLAVREACYGGRDLSVDDLAVKPTAWIEVEKISDGCYRITGSSLTGEWRPEVAVSAWDEEVRVSDYDDYDPPYMLWWNDVTFDMLVGEFLAPNVRRLREAMNHVAFMGWDPADV